MALFPPKPQVPQSAPVPAPTAPTTVALSAEDINRAKKLGSQIRARFAQTLVGQENLRESLITTLVAGGHILIESVPGLAKTTAAQTLATSVSGTFKRVQCTPDLMPSDLIGTQVFDFSTQRFATQIGPIHANFVLLDEINRSNAKTQSAMLEAMAEGATTIGGQRIALPKPFMVIATQNPIEYEGTYPLPEAQLDRFLVKLELPLPDRDAEINIIARHQAGFNPMSLSEAGIEPVAGAADIHAAHRAASRVEVSPAVVGYLVDLCRATRMSPAVRLGVSPRGATALLRTSRVWAFLQGRGFVTPDDVKTMAPITLAHRLGLRAEANLEGVTAVDVITGVLAATPVPR